MLHSGSWQKEACDRLWVSRGVAKKKCLTRERRKSENDIHVEPEEAELKREGLARIHATTECHGLQKFSNCDTRRRADSPTNDP